MANHMRLTLLHTNDLHGHVDELACLTAQARRLRADIEAEGGHCLLVDSGDAEERTVLEMAVTKGRAAMAYMRAAGYDLAAIGNGAALSFGPQVIAPMAEEAGFPLLAANLVWADTGQLVAGCTPSLIMEIGRIRLGFIGLAPRWHFWTLFGLQNPDPVPIVRAELRKLRQDGATVVVLLSHLGLAEDLQLLTQIHDIDLVLGAHSHTTIYRGLMQGETLVAQAGDYGRYLGRVDLEIDEDSGQVTNKRAMLIPVDMMEEPDAALLDTVDQQQVLVTNLLAQPIGELSAVLSYDPLEESPAANLLADAVRLRTRADAALCQPTHLLAGMPAGTVTLKRIYRACKSPGNPAWRQMTGAQLLEMLDLGLATERARRIAPWGRGRPNGRIAVSGVTATYDEHAPTGQRLTDVLISGEPLDPQRRYTVAGSDAEMTSLAWEDSDHSSLLSFELSEDDVTYEVPTVLREVLEDYVREHSPVKPPAVGRIRLV